MSRTDISENIKVYLRQRPNLNSEQLSNDHLNNKSGIRSITDDGLTCSYYSSSNKTVQNFKMDYIFNGNNNQTDVYDKVARPIVDSALLGYSGTIFAYGPTASGKTFTMRGGDDQFKGIMPRCIEHLLSSGGKSVEIYASYLQIYCEQITDLLSQTTPNYGISSQNTLSVREKKEGTVYVDGLSRFKIESVDDLWSILAKGDENRNTAETNMNEFSSRSHAALMITIIIKDGDNYSSSNNNEKMNDFSVYKESLLVLVDLAGSERASASEGKDYMRLEEAKSINLSLSSLGNCMSALSEGRAHIPYRDSKLTRLLQGCLGGSSRTAVIVNLPPGEDTTGEVLNAIRFAARASKVKVIAKISKCKDYESLYMQAKRTIEELEKSKKENIIKENSNLLQRQLDEKDNKIEQQMTEIESLKARLVALESSSITTLAISPKKGQSNNTNSSITYNDSEIDEKIKEITNKHIQSLETIERNFQTKLNQYKKTTESATQELSTLQDELTLERQRHLTTIQDFRSIQEKKSVSENKLKIRIEELLSELSDKRSTIDDLNELIQSLTLRANNAEKEVKEMKILMSDMVSKEQVKEMENLFMDTVTKLSNRVNMLEKPGPQTGKTVSTTNNNSSVASKSQYNNNNNNNNNNNSNRMGIGSADTNIRNSKVEQGRVRAVPMNPSILASLKDSESKDNNKSSLFHSNSMNKVEGYQADNETNYKHK